MADDKLKQCYTSSAGEGVNFMLLAMDRYGEQRRMTRWGPFLPLKRDELLSQTATIDAS